LQTLKGHQLHNNYKQQGYWLEVMVFMEHMALKEDIKHKPKAVTKCPTPTNALSLETIWV